MPDLFSTPGKPVTAPRVVGLDLSSRPDVVAVTGPSGGYTIMQWPSVAAFGAVLRAGWPGLRLQYAATDDAGRHLITAHHADGEFAGLAGQVIRGADADAVKAEFPCA